MPQPAPTAHSADAIDPAAAVARLATLPAGRSATVIGLPPTSLLEAASALGARRLLLIEPGGSIGAQEAIARILEDLADLALATWPDWLSPDATPLGPTPWRRAADRLAAIGRRPLFRSVDRGIQFAALHAAAGAPILVIPFDPARPDRAAPLIATLEWCAGRGAATVALLPEAPAPEPPWDRILHGAIVVEAPPVAPVLSRLVPPLSPGHHGSAVERRMRAALGADADLAGLFANEVTLRLGPLGPTPRVDLLWAEGKIVVELDGLEHERDPTYAADRHRDYELLVAGYLVLRLTNAEVDLDLARSLDKVRRVVNLRRAQP